MSLNMFFMVFVFIFGVVPLSDGWVFSNGVVLNKGNGETSEDTKIKLIYPGTKWCGSDSIAENYDDLDEEVEADKCCRDHDNCPDIITAGETKYNLTNEAFYTRLSCTCDIDFQNCLHNANTSTASNIGGLYFNLISTKCFREDYPITGCAKYDEFWTMKCVEYTYDNDGTCMYQWFDVPIY